MQFKDIINGSSLKLNDISSEEWREYEFEENKKVRIENPLGINVSKSGGHRVIDAGGITHYVPKGWFHISWKPKDGKPHLVI